jgi:uncharacterized protein YjiS (DUF1127 family)
MSTSFKFPPRSFVKHEGFNFDALQNAARAGRSTRPTSKIDPRIAAFLLKDDHLVLLAVDGLLALHARYKAWRARRRTLKALADLDERQLRDIGLTREDTLFAGAVRLPRRHDSYRALAELDASELSNLSEHGIRAWREAHRAKQQGR